MKIIKNSLCIATMAVLSFSMVSCENENIGTPASVSEVNDLNASQIQTRSRSGGLNEGIYKIKSNYKTSYYHLKQIGNECSWTNYVLCAAAIIRANGDDRYPFHTGNIVTKQNYKNKIAHCKKDCKYFVDDGVLDDLGVDDPSHIYALEKYSKDVDASKYNISSRVFADNDIQTVKEIAQHFKSKGTPFLCIGAVRSNSSNSYAVRNNNGEWWVGHYYIIWRITWNGSIESSDIWYTNTITVDGSSFEDHLKSESLDTFFARKTNIGYSKNNILFLY